MNSMYPLHIELVNAIFTAEQAAYKKTEAYVRFLDPEIVCALCHHREKSRP